MGFSHGQENKQQGPLELNLQQSKWSHRGYVSVAMMIKSLQVSPLPPVLVSTGLILC